MFLWAVNFLQIFKNWVLTFDIRNDKFFPKNSTRMVWIGSDEKSCGDSGATSVEW